VPTATLPSGAIANALVSNASSPMNELGVRVNHGGGTQAA